jgi:hypothetical protein
MALTQKLVVLKYSFPGAEEWYPIGSAFTDEAGNYNTQWLNTATGTFTLRVEWKGDGTIPSASANVTLMSLPSQNGVFFVESNSTVTALAFNSTSSELNFNVSGPSDTLGYVKATVAKSLLPNGTDAKIYLDGNQFSYNLQETAEFWLFTFTYHHSMHTVSIDLSSDKASTAPFDGKNSVWILAAVAIFSLVLVFGIFLQKSKVKKSSTAKSRCRGETRRTRKSQLKPRSPTWSLKT